MLVFRVRMSLTIADYNSSIGLFISDKYYKRKIICWLITKRSNC